ncbi:putative enzyme of poly-gamma-glutamate biosynthesis (capsule formation) [Candidatus Methanoperedens nitroreducens]|uniref:Putative enzyme of poly-gamma-glutamate biosynthesis (Capsule formation) n=1 Tax=Candidatus Methanoperedens nitratireducens TaxID=1392998 RepID=A0A062V0E0_9EURY|nr:CapA family protein [Candidatus Methanoperedens nitroreducens]KCZ72611.1 putative enzyme of poly-gamma-glutamate biosynthesis (capsule formation) [Candidatus Methanoperedens nitroreducens]MDJ1423457.1 CapA family protein [Candidatus Methanoperedens sp.]
MSTAGEGEIALAFTGDVMLGRLVNEMIRHMGPYYVWGDTLELFKKADLRLINLECVIAKDGAPWDKTPKVFFFRADPHAIDVLKVAGIDYVSLSNNHTLDFGEEAMLEMLNRLNEAGIAHAGAGHNLREASEPAVLKVGNMRVGVVSFTDNEPAFAATETSPGTNYIQITLADKVMRKVRAAIDEARSLSDIVVFSIHWGPNMRLRPTPGFVEFAHAVIDMGVDIFHGHSSHIFQGVEVYRERLIMYDTGDFIDDYYVGPEEKNDQQLLFIVILSGGRIKRLEMIPVEISMCQVNTARGDVHKEISDRITMLSAEFGTSVKKRNGRLVIDIEQ